MSHFFHNIVQPFASQQAGSKRQRRYAKLLAEYPYSLICPYCSHIVKRK